MKLTDLNPHWATIDGIRSAIWFDCPSCRTQALRIQVRPIEIPPPSDWTPRAPIWTHSGSDFKDITITPSIDLSATGHWHGSITRGLVTTIGNAPCAHRTG